MQQGALETGGEKEMDAKLILVEEAAVLTDVIRFHATRPMQAERQDHRTPGTKLQGSAPAARPAGSQRAPSLVARVRGAQAGSDA